MAKLTEATEIFVPAYLDLKDIYDRHERAHWLPDEAKMDDDVAQWKRGDLSPQRKEFIKMILRLFTQSDTNVCAGYVEKLLPVYKNADARVLLLSFAARESVHMYAYKRLNDTLGYDSEAFLSEFLSYKQMADKHMFMIEEADMSTPQGRIAYLGKQILLEGVNLFAAFAMLLQFKLEGLLPGMVSVNQWSIVDESMHIEGLTSLFHKDLKENPKVINDEFKKTMYETARTVVKLEDEFIDLCYSTCDEGISKEDVKKYVRFVCDYRMIKMGLKPQFGIEETPLPWIDEITGNLFGNFFEVTITEYSKESLTGDWVYPENM